MRPCLFAGTSEKANELCPVHEVCPSICARAKAGDPLIPGMNSNNPNRLQKRQWRPYDSTGGVLLAPFPPHGRGRRIDKRRHAPLHYLKIRSLCIRLPFEIPWQSGRRRFKLSGPASRKFILWRRRFRPPTAKTDRCKVTNA